MKQKVSSKNIYIIDKFLGEMTKNNTKRSKQKTEAADHQYQE